MFVKTKEKKPEKKKESLPESIAGIAAVLVLGLFILTFMVQAFEIPSESMVKTLLVGDHVFVDRLSPTAKAGYVGPLIPYREIKHGDIIVFLHPKEPGMYVVKRIIGVPGDRIHLRDSRVYRNGEALNEPYVIHSTGSYSPYRDQFPAVAPDGDSNVNPEWPIVMREHLKDGDLVVPPDSYFGMGDNRDVSLDSRFWGFIPRENVIGRPLFIYWSFDTPKDQYERTSMADRVGFFVHVVTHFFGETRWSRMFHLVR
ncbi:MAG TPA: signal peptidase I [Candidatus Angelobacter sp.]